MQIEESRPQNNFKSYNLTVFFLIDLESKLHKNSTY